MTTTGSGIQQSGGEGEGGVRPSDAKKGIALVGRRRSTAFNKGRDNAADKEGGQGDGLGNPASLPPKAPKGAVSKRGGGVGGRNVIRNGTLAFKGEFPEKKDGGAKTGGPAEGGWL